MTSPVVAARGLWLAFSLAACCSAFSPVAPSLPVARRSLFLRATPFDHAAAFLPAGAASPDALSSVLLSGLLDGDSAVAAQTTFDAAVAADAATGAAAAADTSGSGGLGFLAAPIEFLLVNIQGVVGSWGVSIILMTLLIKLVTFPLTQTQLTSSSKMQLLQPQIKAIQAKYASNPEVMNQKVAAVYQDNEVNPLAGCLPAFVQIPVFVGLYRAVLNLAKEDCLNQSFLWLPNLEGPTYGADPAQGSDWILKGWTAAGPTLGWADTLAFLSIPVLLVGVQAVSTKLMAPVKNPDAPEDPNDPSNNVVLKFLPLLIGWFSLNVPSALGIYWVTNTLVSTASTVLIKNSIASSMPELATPAAAPMPVVNKSVYTAPVREKPSGFAGSGGSAGSSGGVTPITQEKDAAIETTFVEVETVAEGEGSGGAGKPYTGPKKKKKKKKRGGGKK